MNNTPAFALLILEGDSFLAIDSPLMSALYALAAFAMTLAGGAFAFRYRQYLLYIMAFSSGLLIGVAFLDLVPEVFELAHLHTIDIRVLMLTLIMGFLAIFLLEKLTIIHSEKQHDEPVGISALIRQRSHLRVREIAVLAGYDARHTDAGRALLVVDPPAKAC